MHQLIMSTDSRLILVMPVLWKAGDGAISGMVYIHLFMIHVFFHLTMLTATHHPLSAKLFKLNFHPLEVVSR